MLSIICSKCPVSLILASMILVKGKQLFSINLDKFSISVLQPFVNSFIGCPSLCISYNVEFFPGWSSSPCFCYFSPVFSFISPFFNFFDMSISWIMIKFNKRTTSYLLLFCRAISAFVHNNKSITSILQNHDGITFLIKQVISPSILMLFFPCVLNYPLPCQL